MPRASATLSRSSCSPVPRFPGHSSRRAPPWPQPCGQGASPCDGSTHSGGEAGGGLACCACPPADQVTCLQADATGLTAGGGKVPCKAARTPWGLHAGRCLPGVSPAWLPRAAAQPPLCAVRPGKGTQVNPRQASGSPPHSEGRRAHRRRDPPGLSQGLLCAEHSTQSHSLQGVRCRSSARHIKQAQRGPATCPGSQPGCAGN